MRCRHFTLAILLWCSTLLVSNADTKSDTPEQKQKMQDYIASWNGDFHLHIRIVDERGNPVNGVRVAVSASTFKGWDSSDSISHTIANGEYLHDFSDCKVITLDFFSPNHHKASIEYVFSNPKSSVRIVNRKHFYDNETLVLKTVGNAAKLSQYELGFSYSPSRGSNILNLAKLKDGKQISYYDSTAPTTATIPGMYLAWVPSGEPVEPVMGRQLSNPAEMTPKNAYLELVLDDGATTGTGGFVIVPSKGKTKDQDMRISMTTAPEKGYQKRLRLTKDMLLAPTGPKPVFFYFRFLGLYGKGEITTCQYRHREIPSEKFFINNAVVHIEFKVQYDGSRNVTTKE